MTDSDIIKALECCTRHVECATCPMRRPTNTGCAGRLIASALDLIKRQQEEIEQLKAEKYNLIRNYKECAMEVVRDFAERLKARSYTARTEWSHGKYALVVETDDIDEIVAEMVGENGQ